VPVVPELDVPELNVITPLTPDVPAFAERIVIAPVVVAVPSPDVSVIAPPVCLAPRPAVSCIAPPRPPSVLLPNPEETLIEPPAFDAAVL
jgi:hypothetical protein